MEPIVIETTINAPIQKVWQALTDKSAMQEWYFTITDFVLKHDAVFNFYEGPDKNYHHQCKVLKVEAPVEFSHTWTHPSHSKGSSVVTWKLTEVGNQTQLHFTHDGVENFADGGKEFYRESYAVGWDEIINQSLKKYVEQSA